ncbi:helix-turn-helix domain-containing protein [Paraburkholderia sp. CNPSo 3076]|uniref:GlxA family transcriptional regulator n=1 Tax=Paraburkholderia sp. CNPSo 3076 TaxID=2940936 RepID=UPI0022597025|nr:helix-turn-helix domain-containing protein [Paraburkholderia sp. CNPSo 3076]MCX5540715.1 helix-turn-helix domain-containing protein [Paraburkholderia sp. CNPSo 3076]
MKVAIVVLDGVQAMDMAGLLDVFSEANRLLGETRQYQVLLIGVHAGEVACSNAMQLCVPWAYADFRANIDVLLVTGAAHATHARPKQDFLDWLRRRAFESNRYGCVCNGAWLLGRAGLLDGKEIAARWSDASRMASEFPRARIRPDKNLIRDGRLISSAGAVAGLDLGLALIAQDWGQKLAEQVARRLGANLQSEPYQRNPDDVPLTDESSIIGKVRRHIDDHLSDVLSIEQLAEAVYVSRRTLSRIFAKYLHTTPSAFVDQVRVGAAKRLLQERNIPMKTVAFDCGFHNATHMRMVFQRRLKLTPRQYRQQSHTTEAAA